jgi:hypothetical protein
MRSSAMISNVRLSTVSLPLCVCLLLHLALGTPTSFECRSALDCGLNGECASTTSTCVCDKGLQPTLALK